jgi:cyclic pyranopterin phosphate synthase
MAQLLDRLGRVHEYLRLSVTDRCNLRCRYCAPAGDFTKGGRTDLLDFAEIVRLAEALVSLGIRKIRLTGGEPLLRRRVETLCAALAALPGLEVLGLSTNGVLLKARAASLKAAGVQQLNISLDTLRPDRFRALAQNADLEAVLAGIEEARGLGFGSLKLNTVVIRGLNSDELVDFVGFAVTLGLKLRFIEYMPFRGNGWNPAEFMPCSEMQGVIEGKYALAALPGSTRLAGPAREFQVAGTDAVVGFIPALSVHFCGDCNRLRLSADGKLRNCLFATDELDLRMLLRSGASQAAVESAIRTAVAGKWDKHPELDLLEAAQGRPMVSIGG